MLFTVRMLIATEEARATKQASEASVCVLAFGAMVGITAVLATLP